MTDGDVNISPQIAAESIPLPTNPIGNGSCPEPPEINLHKC